jgi:hypothetical protein
MELAAEIERRFGCPVAYSTQGRAPGGSKNRTSIIELQTGQRLIVQEYTNPRTAAGSRSKRSAPGRALRARRSTPPCPLKSNEPAPNVAEEFEAVFGLSLPTDHSARERAVSLVLSDLWLPLGLVRPEVDLTAAPRVRTAHYGGLVGVLAVEVVRTALQADVGFCSACLSAFETNSTPQQGRDAYCEEIGCKRVRWRRAKARERCGAPRRRVRTSRSRGTTSVDQIDAS